MPLEKDTTDQRRKLTEPEHVEWHIAQIMTDTADADETIDTLRALSAALQEPVEVESAEMVIEVIDVSEKLPPKGVPVIVSGGIAMLKTGGEWFTGMEEPLFQRPLQWAPLWWAPIPGDNVPPRVVMLIDRGG